MQKKRLLSGSRDPVQLSNTTPMTLPDERYRAVKAAQQFLARLAGGEYPRVPKAVRVEARAILRHYPLDWDLKQAADAAPHVFQKEMEPLYRMVKQHEQQQQEQDKQHTGP